MDKDIEVSNRMIEAIKKKLLETLSDLKQKDPELELIKVMLAGKWRCEMCGEREQSDEGIYCKFHLIWEPLPCSAWQPRKEEQ